MDGYWTVEEAAAEVGVSSGHIRKLCAARTIICHRVGRRAWLVERTSALLFKQTAQPKGYPRGRPRKPMPEEGRDGS